MHTLVIAALAALAATTFAQAQTISIGTNPQGSLAYATGSAVSKVVIEKGGLKMRVVPQGGPNVVIPLVNSGELEFSVANGAAVDFAFAGRGEFKKANPDIRVVAMLFNLYSGFLVAGDSNIKSVSDLKGKRVASDFLKQRNVFDNAKGVLNTAGLSYDDVQPVPVPNGVRGVEDLEAGNVDATFFSLESGQVKQADASLSGGVKVLPVDTSDEARRKLNEFTPGWITMLQPGPSYPGVSEPIGAYTLPFVVIASVNTPDDVVYKFVKTLHDNKAALVASDSSFEAFDSDHMKVDIGVPYHSGAEKFYAEIGQ